ncbi:hypothetical protein GVAV_003169 [Gurleya vavrai]
MFGDVFASIETLIDILKNHNFESPKYFVNFAKRITDLDDYFSRKIQDFQSLPVLEIENLFVNKLNFFETQISKNLKIKCSKDIKNKLINPEKIFLTTYTNLITDLTFKFTNEYVLESFFEDSILHCSAKIYKITPNIKMLYNLRSLQLCCNLLISIPNEISKLNNLKKLSLPRNLLIDLPKDIGLLYKLTDLDLSHNHISTFPDSFSALRRLFFLTIYNNRFFKMPVHVCGSKCLTFFYFGNNYFETIPIEVLSLPWYKEHLFLPNSTSKLSQPSVPNYILSLKELSLRYIVMNATDIPYNLSDFFRNKLLAAKECYLCGGPYIDFYLRIYLQKLITGKKFKISVNMCSNHLKNLQFISIAQYKTLACGNFEKLSLRNYPSIREIFIYQCYNAEKIKEIVKWKKSLEIKASIPFFNLLTSITEINTFYLKFAIKREKTNFNDQETGRNI